MATYLSPVEIANRALQMCGAQSISTMDDDSKNADAVRRCYEELRQAELRRNVWRFAIRTAALRAIDERSMILSPPTYDATKTYGRGAIVAFGSSHFICMDAAAVDVSPFNTLAWNQYFGNFHVTPWTINTTYYAGELVYTPSNTAYKVYMSLQDNNTDIPGIIADYDAAVTYRKGDTVISGLSTYMSLVDLNFNNSPAGTPDAWGAIPGTQDQSRTGQRWIEINSAARAMEIMYPIGSGPRTQTYNSNLYLLPVGFLRMAPQDPKGGAWNRLGASSATGYADWDLEGPYLKTSDTPVVVFRYVADIAEVYAMDPLFCTGLACRIALEVCEELTQSDAKLQALASRYSKFMGEARIVNGIETGPTEAPEDDFIACRR